MIYSIYIGNILSWQTGTDETWPLLSPKLNLEVNEPGSCDFTLLPAHPMYDNIQQLATIVEVHRDGDVLFRGRVTSFSTDIYGQMNVSCEGDLAFLNDSQIKEVSEKKTIKDRFTWIVQSHNRSMDDSTYKKFTVGECDVKPKHKSASEKIDYTTGTSPSGEYKTARQLLDDDCVSWSGGYLRTRTVGNKHYLDLMTPGSYGPRASQHLKLSYNLLDCTKNSYDGDIFTTVIGQGAESGKGKNRKPVECVPIGSSELLDYFGGTIVHVEKFDDVDQEPDLSRKVMEFLNEQKEKMLNTPSFSIKALDINWTNDNVDPFDLGNKFTIEYPVYRNGDAELAEEKNAICISMSIDLESPENTTLEFGDHDTYSAKSITKATTSAGRSGGGAAGAANNLYKYYTEVEDQATINAKDIKLLGDRLTVAVKELEFNVDGEISMNARRIVEYVQQANNTVSAEINKKINDEIAKADATYAKVSRVTAIVKEDIEKGNNGGTKSDLYKVMTTAIKQNPDVMQLIAEIYTTDKNGKRTSKIPEQIAEIAITPNNIRSRVKKKDLESIIEQTGEQIKLSAKNISISGYTTMGTFNALKAIVDEIDADYVTTKKLDAVKADIKQLKTDTANIKNLTAGKAQATKLWSHNVATTNLSTSSMSFDRYSVSWKSFQIFNAHGDLVTINYMGR